MTAWAWPVEVSSCSGCGVKRLTSDDAAVYAAHARIQCNTM
jgi:hypothetical protein